MINLVVIRSIRFETFVDKLKQLPLFDNFASVGPDGACVVLQKTTLQDFFTYKQILSVYNGRTDYTSKIGKMRTIRGFSDEHLISQLEEQIFIELLDSARNTIDLGLAETNYTWKFKENILDDITETNRLVRTESQQHVRLLVVSPLTHTRICDVFNKPVSGLRGIKVVSSENFKSNNHALAIAASAGLFLINEYHSGSSLKNYHIGFVVTRPQNILMIENMFRD